MSNRVQGGQRRWWSNRAKICWFWHKGRCSAPRFCSVAHDAEVVIVSTLAPAPSGVLVSEAPRGGHTKVLWHRQLWQDCHQRRLGDSEEVHHLDEDKGNNKARNLVMVAARAHRQHHARGRRRVPVWGRRVRAPRRR